MRWAQKPPRCRHRSRHRSRGGAIVHAKYNERRFGFCLRQNLEGNFAENSERTPRPGQQFAQIEPSDVLDHATAGLEGLAASRYRDDAEKMIARGADADTTRPGHVRRQHATDGAKALRAAKQRAVVHRLEGKFLTVRCE